MSSGPRRDLVPQALARDLRAPDAATGVRALRHRRRLADVHTPLLAAQPSRRVYPSTALPPPPAQPYRRVAPMTATPQTGPRDPRFTVVTAEAAGGRRRPEPACVDLKRVGRTFRAQLWQGLQTVGRAGSAFLADWCRVPSWYPPPVVPHMTRRDLRNALADEEEEEESDDDGDDGDDDDDDDYVDAPAAAPAAGEAEEDGGDLADEGRRLADDNWSIGSTSASSWTASDSESSEAEYQFVRYFGRGRHYEM